MTEPKTRPTGASVSAFIAAASDDPERRDDCRALISLMTRVTGAKAEMWGPSIVGCGRFLYKCSSSPAYLWPLAAFSPRKPDIVVYVMWVNDDRKLLARLGKHKAPGVSCIYIRRLADVDMSVLETLIEHSAAKARAMGEAEEKAAKAKAAKVVKPAKPKRAASTARPKPARKPARAR